MSNSLGKQRDFSWLHGQGMHGVEQRVWLVQMERNTVRSALRCLECYRQGFIFLDLSQPDVWQILYVSPEAVDQTGAHHTSC